ncbi:hypothetical protein [Indiicoccus explosivorum]|uniref:hypothetical protein n=1 Tax=Indiicoccus explosivorum TaxID=1917864 RepID=UPI000B4510A5|nr:hypothetical protein [Indiicoccus explosivorum]
MMGNKLGPLLLAGLLLGGCATGGPESVQEQTADRYMDESGLIRAYPMEPESGVLAESLGLYMDYLLMTDDAEGFEHQTDQLERYFIDRDGGPFIRWRLFHDTQVNALVDDVRIIQALNKGSARFGVPAYRELAAELAANIGTVQRRDGVTVDFYDWQYGLAADRVTLSYLSAGLPGVIEPGTLLMDLDGSKIFFPEYYDLESGTYKSAPEVQLVDQLLIAINRQDAGLESEAFDAWLSAEWERNGRLYGRYVRKSGEAAVGYESLAVYYFLHRYFTETGKEAAAGQTAARADQLYKKSDKERLHFFDFILYHTLKAEREGEADG